MVFRLLKEIVDLYDGIDIQGSTSTAELAKLLKTPVVLCIDCTKSTRTMAAAVVGVLNILILMLT